MRKTNIVRSFLLLFGILFSVATPLSAGEQAFIVVDTDKCVTESKIGKQEMEFLQTLQDKFEKDLLEKEKAVKDISVKFNDDYLESLSEDAVKKLKEEFEIANQAFGEARQQTYQMFHQAKQQIMDKLFKWTSQASEVVVKAFSAKAAIQAEDLLYYEPSLDKTDNVTEELDKMYLKELEQQTAEHQVEE